MEKIGSFFQGRRAVGYHHPAERGIRGKELVDALGELQPFCWTNRGAPNPDRILGLYFSNSLGFGDTAQHLLNAHTLAYLRIENIVQPVRAKARNAAASRDDVHFRTLRSHRVLLVPSVMALCQTCMAG